MQLFPAAAAAAAALGAVATERIQASFGILQLFNDFFFLLFFQGIILTEEAKRPIV